MNLELPDGRISRKNAAIYIGVSPDTLRVWNSTGRHDHYFKKIKIAGRVYYDFSKVQEFCNWTNES